MPRRRPGTSRRGYRRQCGGTSCRVVRDPGFPVRSRGHQRSPVLNRDPAAAVPVGQSDEVADRGPQSAIALTGRAGEIERKRVGLVHRVAVRIEHHDGEVVSVEIDAEQSFSPHGKFGGCRQDHRIGAPGRVHIPAIPVGVERDVVPDRLVDQHPVEPVVTAVVEGDGAVEPIPAARAVRQMPQRQWQHDRDGPLWGNRDGVVAMRGTCLAVRGEEQSRRVPPFPPTESRSGPRW
jgi:hypothetical protein